MLGSIFGEKSMPRCIPSWTSFLDRFLIDFDFQLGPPNLEKSSPRCRESAIFQKSPFEVSIAFLCDFCPNLAPFSLPKSTKIQKTSLLKGIYFFIYFCIDFLSILAPSWPPTWSHLGGQDASKSEKMALKNFYVAPLLRFWIRTCF